MLDFMFNIRYNVFGENWISGVADSDHVAPKILIRRNLK